MSSPKPKHQSAKKSLKSKSQENQTILLRQAEPRYSFVGKKLPKKEETSSKLQPSVAGDESQRTPQNTTLNSKRPVAIVEGSCQSMNNGSISVQAMATSVPKTESQGNIMDSQYKVSPSVSGESSPSLLQFPAKLSNSPSQHVIEDTASSLALKSITNSLTVAERLQEVEVERDKLKMELEVQLQVNSELKRLLVASVGEDLGERVQRLVRDRAQLSFDMGGCSKKMREDYENLDKVSIQADMWRSKYLASRVMIEELGNARAFYSLQCHDAQDALQQMLNERHELRTNLLDSYKVLQQVKGAFDPLNSHRSSSLPSTNVLDLSRSCQQLAEAIRFRLLPAHVSVPTSTELDLESWENSVTKAEQYAHELLSRPPEPPGSLQSGSSHLLPIAGPPSSQSPSPLINRFHPHVRHDNLHFTCCKCKGEISVV